MNKRDLAKFEKILTREKERLLKGIYTLEDLSNGNKENTGFGIHMADTGNEEEELEKNLLYMSREGDTLALIDEALEKIKQGTYGICEHTGKPIPKERLIAKPFAKYSLEARRELERQGMVD